MDHDHPPPPVTVSLGRIVAWPLIVGGCVLAIALVAWEIARGMPSVDAVSTAVSGLAAFALAVVAVAISIDLVTRAASALTNRQPKFLSLDWMVPLAVVFGFLLGLAVWH
jgi:hypothetical protein